ncbi:MAG: competence/damage-inducible protein A [bacterium]
MNVELISIGDELLIGQTVNSNAAYLGSELTSLGLDVKWVTTVGDDAEELTTALKRAMARSDVVITTGGLGPTHDDITKKVAAQFFDSAFVFKPEILERLKKAFAKRGLVMSAVNEDQANVPEKAEIIDNPVGTAPGFLFTAAGKKCFILPGVPAEMKAMCQASVFPRLKSPGQTILLKTLRTTGIPESNLFERLHSLISKADYVKVAFLPKIGGVDIRLTVKGTDAMACQQNMEKALTQFQEKIGDYLYGYGEEPLEEVVARLLIENKKSLAVAESCTGGLLAHKLTNISGSSNYFERGVVAYSNQAKMDILGVRQSTLEKFGAVSSQTAVEMAEGVKGISSVDFGLSTTGIAGPTGGTTEKPVGLVYIGFAGASGSYAREFRFFKNRLNNKERSVQAALNILRTELEHLSKT